VAKASAEISSYRSGEPLRHPKARTKTVNRCATQKQNQTRIFQQR
jgi:hypothetical protein